MTKSPTFHLNAVDLNLLDDNAFRNSPWCSSSGIGEAAWKNPLTYTDLLLREAGIRSPSCSFSVQVEGLLAFQRKHGLRLQLSHLALYPINQDCTLRSCSSTNPQWLRLFLFKLLNLLLRKLLWVEAISVAYLRGENCSLTHSDCMGQGFLQHPFQSPFLFFLALIQTIWPLESSEIISWCHI